MSDSTQHFTGRPAAPAPLTRSDVASSPRGHSGGSPDRPPCFEITETLMRDIRIPYGLRNVSAGQFAQVQPLTNSPVAGDIILASVERIGKNTRVELANGRPCTLHVGDLVAVVFGNRYATMQFEGYARAEGDTCDLLSMGGLCGLVESRHSGIAESSKLRILGSVAGPDGRPLRLRDFALPRRTGGAPELSVVVVCGSSMDAGKTYTAASLIAGLRKVTDRVAGIKLTGTAAGRDSWTMLDAGACTVLDFVDGGYPSTYLVSLPELLDLHQLLLEEAAARGAKWAVVEIADGLLQGETAALIQSRAFTRTVDAWVFAAGDPLAAVSGVKILSGWGITPLGISGRVTMSPLCVREASAATGMTCFSAADLQAGRVNHQIAESALPPAGVQDHPAAVGVA